MRTLCVIFILALEIENGSPKKLEKVVRKRENILAKNHFQSSSFLLIFENLGLLKIKFKSINLLDHDHKHSLTMTISILQSA